MPSANQMPVTGSSKRKKSAADRPGPGIIMRAIHQMMDAGHGINVPPCPGVPNGQLGVLRTGVKEVALKLGYDDQDGNKRNLAGGKV